MHHVGSIGFGDGITPYTVGTPMYNVIMDTTVKDDWTSQLVFMEAYDQGYGIYDHEQFDDHDPLSIIGMHPAEDVITGSRMKTMARELIACRVPELTNTPLLDLMNYPQWMLDDLMKDGRKARIKDAAELAALEAAAKQG